MQIGPLIAEFRTARDQESPKRQKKKKKKKKKKKNRKYTLME